MESAKNAKEIIRIKNLNVSFGHHLALKNISFSVYEGDFLAIIGGNGSGKSTLIKSILNLIPYEGEIIFLDLELFSNIGYLAQFVSVESDFPATSEEVIMTGFLKKNHFFYTKETKLKAQEIIDRLELKDFIKQSFNTLSGGQKRRILIARALAAGSRILILDEATTGLDNHSEENFYKILQILHQNYGLTVLIVTHDLKHLRGICNRVLTLDIELVSLEEVF